MFDAVDEATVMPRLIRLQPNLYVAAFFLMKLLPAQYILSEARREGKIEPGAHVIESTSGTFGLALAILCNRYGYSLTLVSDPIVSDSLRQRMTQLGAKVDIVTQPSEWGGFQGARLERLQRYLDVEPGAFWPAQYSNPRNPAAYAAIAEYLHSTIGRIDCLVGSVGSGGSMCGTTKYLRLTRPGLKSVAVDHPTSVLFGRPDGLRLVRGLGNSILPENLDHSCFDEVHWLDSGETFLASRELHERYGIFMGATTGAAYRVAEHYVRHNPEDVTVFLGPDEGYRYEGSAYNPDWLKHQGVWLETSTNEPTNVTCPAAGDSPWFTVNWQRRSLPAVTGVASRDEG